MGGSWSATTICVQVLTTISFLTNKAPKTLHSPAVKDRNFVSEQDKNPHEVEALKTNQNKHSELNQTFISSYIHFFL
jgi:hypothetical protein